METIEAIKNAIKCTEECYYAFNKLALLTSVHFFNVNSSLLDAKKLLDGWLKNLEEEVQ